MVPDYTANLIHSRVVISVKSEPIDPVLDFPYLGRTVVYNNSVWEALHQNIKNDRWWWGLAGKVPTKAVSTVRARGMFYKVLFQMMFLYGSEIWMLTGVILTVLESFHNRMARRIVGKTYRHAGDGGWECPPVEEALELAGLWPIE